MTHAGLLTGLPNVPGLGPSDCPGGLHAVGGSVPDGATDVEVLRCAACGVRIAWEPATGRLRNVYAVPDVTSLARGLAEALDARPRLAPSKE
jgi:hypothetical protein